MTGGSLAPGSRRVRVCVSPCEGCRCVPSVPRTARRRLAEEHVLARIRRDLVLFTCRHRRPCPKRYTRARRQSAERDRAPEAERNCGCALSSLMREREADGRSTRVEALSPLAVPRNLAWCASSTVRHRRTRHRRSRRRRRRTRLSESQGVSRTSTVQHDTNANPSLASSAAVASAAVAAAAVAAAAAAVASAAVASAASHPSAFGARLAGRFGEGSGRAPCVPRAQSDSAAPRGSRP